MVRVIDVLYCTDDGCIQRNAEPEILDHTRNESRERDAPLRLFDKHDALSNSRAFRCRLPSTSDVKSVTVAALRRPAGRFTPIFSSFSRRILPPFFDFALRRIPPSSDALRHSGGDRRRWTSATHTLYFEFELSSDNRPGTLQKTSVGAKGPLLTPRFN